MLKSMTFRSTLAAVAWAISFAAHALADTPKQINVPAGELVTALESLAKQAAVDLVYQPEQLKSFHTKGVKGTYEPKDAVRILLKGTPLELRTDPTGAMVISPLHTNASTSQNEPHDDVGKPDDPRSRLQLAQATPGSNPSTPPVGASSPSPGTREGTRRADEGTQKIEEIVVTAQKRSERLQDVPVSIAVLDAAAINNRGLVSADDYLRSVPAVSYVDQGPGQNIIVIRGAYGVPYDTGPTVGLYFGDIPLAGLALGGSTDIKLVDIQRVEVLRGPQGTLYGSNSLSGTIKYVPNQPDLNKLDVNLGVGYSSTGVYGGGNNEVEGVVNVPVISGRLAIRVAAYDFQNSGYIKNVAGDNPYLQASAAYFGASGQAGNQDNVGGTRYSGARISILWTPIDELNANFTYMWQSDDARDRPFAQRGFPEYERATYSFGPIVGDGYALNMDLDIKNLTLDYRVPWGSFSSSTAIVDQDYRRLWDIGTFFQVNGFTPPIPQDSHTAAHVVTEESRFTSAFSGPFQVIAGLYYESSRQVTPQPAFYTGASALNPFGPGIVGPIYTYYNDRRIDQLAEFGELSYAITPELKLTVGGRHFHYDTRFIQGITQTTNPNIIPPSPSDVSGGETGDTLKGSVEYKFAGNTLLYAKYSQGFRLGRPQDLSLLKNLCGDPNGFIVGTDISVKDALIASDRIDSTEVGTKTDLYGGRVSLSLSAYHNIWSNIPVTVRPQACLNGIQQVIVNGGKADANGFEFEGALKPIKAFQADFGFGYVDSRLAVTSSIGNKGDLMNYTPKINGHIGAEFRPVIADRETYFRADYTYYGKYWDGVGESGTSFGGYGLLGISAGTTFDRVAVRAFADNVTGKYAITSDSGYPANGIYVVRPRTVGLKLSITF